jgi:SAM-dependent methyltransferase
MLLNFNEQNISVLGIDLAPGPVNVAIKQGIKSVCRFFTRELASELRRNAVHADLVIANNVLAHVADPHGFIDGICEILKPDGMAVIEVPYLRNLIETRQFDTIYHEHLAYFSVRSVCELFARHECSVVDVQKVPTHGGSLRLFIRNNAEGHGPTTRAILTEEQNAGMDEHSWYRTFADAAKQVQQSLRETITSLKAEGKTIAAYGAAAKGTILLNTAGIERHQLEYVVDRNIHKQGQFVPGIDLPIFAPDKILETQPDYLLILPWNLKEEIIQQEKIFQKRGGRFIVPLPKLMFI